MKELKEFTVEQLERLIHLAGVGCAIYESNTMATLAKIALAAKQANPVGYLFVSPDGGIAYSISNVEFDGVKLVGPVFATPPLNHTEQDGWTSSDAANAALVMLDRIETIDPVDDDRIEGIKRIIHQLVAAPKPEM